MRYKVIIFLSIFLISVQAKSQTTKESFSDEARTEELGKKRKKRFQKFKTTKTVFVLADIYDNETYRRILKEYWTVTPHEVVSASEFEIKDYDFNKHSFAKIEGYRTDKATTSNGLMQSYTLYFNFSMREGKKKKVNMTSFTLYPKENFLNQVRSKKMNEVIMAVDQENVFYNYNTGFFKNYLQYLNKRISSEKNFYYDRQLKELESKILYLPSYTKLSLAKSGFESYNFDYEFIDDEKLSSKILENEELYYLRYVKSNAFQKIEVVNSKTGDVIYVKGYNGISNKIRDVHVKDLNDAIANGSI